MEKEKKDILLVNPYIKDENHILGEENSKKLENLLKERTEGRIWTPAFNGEHILGFEDPLAMGGIQITDNGIPRKFYKPLYVKGKSGLLVPNFELLENLGAAIEIVNSCPREDSYLTGYNHLLMIAPTMIIGDCTCNFYKGKFNTTTYVAKYHHRVKENWINNSIGNRVGSLNSIEDIADFVSGLLVSNKAIQERASSRVKKLKEDYRTLENK